MAAVCVTANNCRRNTAEAATAGTWCAVGGGPGISLEPDFVYQGCNSISRRGQTGPRGIAFTEAGCCTTDLTTACGTYQTWMAKVLTTSPGLLETDFACCKIPFALRLGSGCAAYYQYNIYTKTTYPSRGSWQILPVDPNIASHRDVTAGCPLICAIDFYALMFEVSTQSNATNMAVDAIDVGAGLTLTRGDTACNADGTWCSFVVFDEGTIGNRFGYVSTLECIIFTFGKMVIGELCNPTEFTDTCQILVFPAGLFAQSFSGIRLDVRHACTVIIMTGCTFLGRGVAGTCCVEETRPVFEVTTDCAPGSATLNNIRFDAFDAITINSGVTFNDITVSNSRRLNHCGGLICGIVVNGATGGDGVAFLVTTNPSCVRQGCFTFSDGHAIELTATGCFTFAGNVFNCYGCSCTNDAAIYNNSGGNIVLNVTCCGTGAPSVRNAACSTTCIVAATAVTPTVSNLVSGDRVFVARRCGSTIIKNEFTLAACNNRANTTVVVNCTILLSVPSTDNTKIRIKSESGPEHRYRYDSFTGVTFTLAPCTNGTADACSTNTILIDAAVNFVTAEIEVGDYVRNETDDVVAKIVAVCSANQLTTTNAGFTWLAKAYRINALVEDYEPCTNAYVPIIERVADATSESSCLTHLGTNIPVRVSVRNAGVILPFNLNTTITSAGLCTPAIRNPDEVYV